MTAALAPFLAGWSLMMAAMMLPSALPIIRLHRLSAAAAGWGRDLGSLAFVTGYLLVWSAVGIIVWLAATAVDALLPMDAQTVGVAALLAIAGVYQFTPLKARCLGACRSPMDFLLTHWHRGTAGAVRLGIEHGAYCLGCCWALMAVFVGVGAMELGWAAAIALVILVEKVFPQGVMFGRALGVALVVSGVLVLARPEVAMSFPSGM